MTVLVLLCFLNAGELVQTSEFSTSDLRFMNSNSFDIVELNGFPGGIKPGEPRLPRVVQALVIPAGAVPTDVELVSEEVIELKGNYNIPPAQPDVPLPMPGKFFTVKEVQPDPNIYLKDAYYPDNGVRLVGAGSKSGYRIAHVEFFPLRYNPVKKTLQLATRITYRLIYTVNTASRSVPFEHQRAIFGNDVRSFVANIQDVERFAPLVQKRSGVRFLPPGNYQYVIISGSPSLDSVFQRLADWKTKKGIPATVVQVSWINGNYAGYDLPEKVRNFIIDANATWGTVWVLLGGSADHKSSGQNLIPAREAFYGASGVGYYYDEDTIPCDLYFSDLDNTWDTDNDHVYGELTDDVDMYGDIYVGRASVYTLAQAQNFVNKVLTYEKNPPTDYLRKMLLPTAILWSSYEERRMQDSIARMTPAGWVDGKLYERNSALTRQRMIDSMNAGYGMGAWVGHGDEDGIYTGGSPYLNSSDADGLINGDKQGVAISIACFTGAWDEKPGGGDCFAEHLVNRVGGGLIAAIMNSRYGWGAIAGGSYVPGPSERLDTTFYAKIFHDGFYKCGQGLSVDKDAWVPYADSSAQYYMTRWCLYQLNLLGDPELPLWTDVPQTLVVSFPALIYIGNQIVNVTVTSGGSPVNNALVCLRKGTEAYGTGYTNASGFVAITIAPLSPGLMDITVTARNFYPFEDTINVQTGNYAYVSYLKCSVSDPAGNNNGILNPGESVEIPLWVKNYGSQQGNSITGTLRTTDIYVALSDTIKSFGNIPAGDSATTGSDGYSVVVAGNCPNGHSVLFTLECKDNIDSTWTSQFSIIVYAPVLGYAGVGVIGGNNNGILDPGEMADLIVTIINTGGATAESVTSIIMENSSYITINDTSGNFGTVNPGDTADNALDPYNVSASASTPTGTVVNLSIQVTSGVYMDTLDFSLVVGKMHYYIWNPDPTPTPGANMHAILDSLGYRGDYGTSLAPDLNLYGSVLVCVGIWPNNHIIGSSSTEAVALVNFLQNQGGRMYLEGGDVWYFDPPYSGGYDFGPLFGIDASADGSTDLGPIAGQAGTFTQGMNFTYGGENNWIDHIDPTGTGFLIFRDTDNAYNCGVANAPTGYKTVGTSFELGLLNDSSGVSTRAELLDEIMQFLAVMGGVTEQEVLTGLGAEFGLHVYPSIAKRDVRIAYSLGQMARGTIKIYDASGRVVCSFAIGHQPSAISILWNGTDDLHRSVPAGVYFVKLEAGDRSQVQKVVLLR